MRLFPAERLIGRKSERFRPVSRPPCKSLSIRKTLRPRRARESAHTKDFRVLQLAGVPLGIGSCLRRTGHPFAVLGLERPLQKIEFVFAASPETIRGEPREYDSVAQ